MRNSLRNNLLSQLLLAISQVAFPLVIYPVVTRALKPAGLGEVNFADSIVQTALIIGSLGIPLYGIREIAVHRNSPQSKKTLKELFLLQLAAIIPSLMIIWITGFTSGVSSLLLWTGSIALVSSSLSCEWWFQGNEKFTFIALRTFLVRAVAAVLIYLMVTKPGDQWIYYSILTGSVVVTMLINLLKIFPRVGSFQSDLRPFHHLRSMNWVYACYVAASLFMVMDSLFLGWLTGDDKVGLYSFGYRLVRMASMILPALGVVFIPAIAFHFSKDNSSEVKAQSETSQKIVFLFGIPVSLAFFILAPEIVGLLAGKNFSPSITVIRILSPLPLLISLSHLTGTQLLVSIKKERIYFYFLCAGLTLNAMFNMVLIPTLQEKGAAISNVSTETFVAVSTFLFLAKTGFVRIQFKYFLSCLLPSLILIPLVILIRLSG
ncbi:MAG: flippase, partial [Flavisolibacter sp.]